MQTFSTLLVDSDTDRRAAMLTALTSCSTVYFVDTMTDDAIKRVLRPGNYEVVDTKNFDLILIHPRDKHRVNGVHGIDWVWYGGNGYEDNDIPNGEWAIKRKISTEQAALTKKEACELVAFFPEQDPSKQPSVLNNPKYQLRHVLVADFLSTIKEPEKVNWQEIELIAELKEMTKEWELFKTQVLSLLHERHEKNEKLNPFDPHFSSLLERFTDLAVQ